MASIWAVLSNIYYVSHLESGREYSESQTFAGVRGTDLHPLNENLGSH